MIFFQEEKNLGSHVSQELRHRYAGALMVMMKKIISSMEDLCSDDDGGFINFVVVKNFNAQRGELRKARGACNVRKGEIREIFVAS
jgi:hypothetical protein